MSRIQNPFTLDIVKKEERPGCWNTNIVKVLKNGEQVAEYKRGYPSHTKETFYPFLKNEKWYALISASYTATSIMDLQTGKIIGGEEPSSNGFCPTEFFIPKRYLLNATFKDGVKLSYHIYEGNESYSEKEFEVENEQNSKTFYSNEEYAPFGFVSGCHWGDDSSWKMQMLDLSEADKGILKRTDPFEYAEMFGTSTLKESISIEDEGNGLLLFDLKVLKRCALNF